MVYGIEIAWNQKINPLIPTWKVQKYILICPLLYLDRTSFLFSQPPYYFYLSSFTLLIYKQAGREDWNFDIPNQESSPDYRVTILIITQYITYPCILEVIEV
jgi:hypothetical protein